MKFLINFLTLLLINVAFSQNVIINKVVKTGTNTDKFFYKINPDSVKSEYLGELEITGFSANDTEMFNLIYRKAKSVGANTFAYKPFNFIDDSFAKLDPSHYLLSLYDVKKNDFPDNSNKLYVISSSQKTQKISINNQLVVLPTRTFVLKKLTSGEVYTISTRKLLGSSVKIISDKEDNGQYFQISAFKINSNPYGKAGINIKSGDILKLEKSYGDFLTTIYTEIK